MPDQPTYSWGGGIASNVPPFYFDDFPSDEEIAAVKAAIDASSTFNLPPMLSTPKSEPSWFDIGGLSIVKEQS